MRSIARSALAVSPGLYSRRNRLQPVSESQNSGVRILCFRKNQMKSTFYGNRERVYSNQRSGQPNPRGRVTRFDATDRRPVDKWTAAPRPTTSPQGQKPQQKRSTHMVHKPVNSECSRQSNGGPTRDMRREYFGCPPYSKQVSIQILRNKIIRLEAQTAVTT